MDKRGIQEAKEAGRFLQDLTRQGWPMPDWGVSSDLMRAEETLYIVAKELGIPIMPPLISLRAYEKTDETPISYELRNIQAFDIILARAFRTGTIPLITCHRSSTAFLAKKHGIKGNPDYREDALLLEGGIMALTDRGIKPLFRAKESNWLNISKGEYTNA